MLAGIRLPVGPSVTSGCEWDPAPAATVIGCEAEFRRAGGILLSIGGVDVDAINAWLKSSRGAFDSKRDFLGGSEYRKNAVKVRVEKQIGRLNLIFETGRLAKQAAGSVLVQYGDTVVLNACATGPPRQELISFR